MRRIQYIVGIAALALSAAAVGFAQAPAGAPPAQGRGGQAGGGQEGAARGGGAPPPPVPAVLQNYAPVTEARLKNPEESNWLMLRRTYDGWGFSPLKQITTANVARLKPVWGFATGETRAHEAPVLVNNGVMFVSTPNNQVIALDAKTGNLLWRYRRPRPNGAIVLHDTSRGLALYNDKVYYAVQEAILIALDAKTGREVWTTEVADNKQGYYTSLAPLVGGGGIMMGTSGGELGIRGFIASFDPETGKERWRTYTVPAPGEPGSETWPQGDQWKTGGAPIWITGNYDKDTNTAYWGTGNGGPWMGDQRPGDNLYVASALAIDATTGKIKGHFQYLPNETWDYDEVSPPILVDYRRNGRTVKGLIDVARSGYMWFLDRGDGGTISYVDGKPYVLHNVIRSVDPKTGRPDIDPARRPGTNKEASFCPSFSGGKNWPPVSFSPETRMIYVPANNGLCSSLTGTGPVQYSAGRGYSGVRIGATVFDPRGNPNVGEIQAWDVDTGEKVWTSSPVKSVNWGGMLATAGGVVFNGGTADRKIRAYDAKSGKVLWEHVLDSAPIAPPTTFMLDGKQYLALNVGWGGDAVSVQRSLATAFPGQTPTEVPQGGSIWVFAVE